MALLEQAPRQVRRVGVPDPKNPRCDPEFYGEDRMVYIIEISKINVRKSIMSPVFHGANTPSCGTNGPQTAIPFNLDLL